MRSTLVTFRVGRGFRAAISFFSATAMCVLLSPELAACGEIETQASKLESFGAKLKRDEHKKVRSLVLVQKIRDENIELIDFDVFTDVKTLAVDNRHLTDRSLGHFCKLTALESLFLRRCAVSDKGISTLLSGQKRLKSLTFESMSLSDRAFAQIGNIRSLSEVELSNMPIGIDTIKEIAKLDSLFVLDLPRTGITDECLKEVAKLRKLSFLRLDETKITDGGLRYLATMTKLHSLEMRSTNITDAGLLQLAPLKKLRSLSVTGTKVSEEGKHSLKRLLPDLEIK